MKTKHTDLIIEPVATGRPFLSLFLLFVAPVILGALMAPPVFRGLEWLSEYVYLGRRLTDPPFRRVLSRCVMIIAFFMLYPAVRLSGFRRWSQIGWAPPAEGRRLPRIAVWFGVGVLSMGVAYLLSHLAGALTLETPLPGAMSLIRRWFSRFVGALLIGVLEETLFRGYVYGLLRRRMHLIGALLIGGFIFAAVHFARPVAPPDLDPRHWAAGFRLLPHLTRGIQPHYAAPMFVNLLLMGVLLSLLYDHFGNLYAAIGLHAGWVWMQSIGTQLFIRDETRLWILFGPNKTLSITWAGTLVLVVFMIATLWLRRRRRSA